jgi:hypothetical protein
VAEFERSEEMNRTLIAVLSTVAMVLAVPSFAGKQQPLQPSQAYSTETSGGGVPAPAVVESGRVPAGEMVVNGEVMMSDPDELVVHTSSGIRRFRITRTTEMYAGAAEGDVVTVLYKPEAGSVTVVSVKRVGVSKDGPVQPAKMVKPPAQTTYRRPMAMKDSKPAVMPKTNAKPAVMKMAQAQQPAAAPEPMKNTASTPSAKRLPKTASDLPLIGLVGLLGLAGAVTLRVARARAS